METFAAIAAAFVVAWAALVIVAHRLNPGQNPLSMGMSGLARGRVPWVMKSAFLCRGAAALVLLIALPSVLGAAGLTLAGILAFWIWGVGSAALAVVDTDMPGEPRSRTGSVHAVVALLACICGSAGALVLSVTLTRTDATAGIGGWAFPLALLTLAAMVLQFVAFGAAAQQARAAGVGTGVAPQQTAPAPTAAPAAAMPASAAPPAPPQLVFRPRPPTAGRPVAAPASGALGASLQTDPDRPRRSGPSLSLDALGGYAGLFQRVFVGLLMAWTLLVALGIAGA